MPTLIITVKDPECCRCIAKIQKIICCIQGRGEFVIDKIVYEKDKVLVSGPFDAEKLSCKLLCKAGKNCISKIEIKPDPKPDPPKDPPKQTLVYPYPYPNPYPYPQYPSMCHSKPANEPTPKPPKCPEPPKPPTCRCPTWPSYCYCCSYQPYPRPCPPLVICEESPPCAVM